MQAPLEGDLAARRSLLPRDPLSALYYGIAAYAKFLGRNYDDAMRLAREGIRQRSDFVGAHGVLTAAVGVAGQDDITPAALQELRRAQPNISLAWIAKYIKCEGNGRGPAPTVTRCLRECVGGSQRAKNKVFVFQLLLL
jgi:hypothetical protein